jgi:hypothetical protein
MKTENKVSLKNFNAVWVCVDKFGLVYAKSIALTRTESIQQFVSEYEYGWNKTWQDFKKNGHRCVKVYITFNEIIKTK